MTRGRGVSSRAGKHRGGGRGSGPQLNLTHVIHVLSPDSKGQHREDVRPPRAALAGGRGESQVNGGPGRRKAPGGLWVEVTASQMVKPRNAKPAAQSDAGYGEPAFAAGRRAVFFAATRQAEAVELRRLYETVGRDLGEAATDSAAGGSRWGSTRRPSRPAARFCSAGGNPARRRSLRPVWRCGAEGARPATALWARARLSWV